MQTIFKEYFAGKAELSKAVAKVGVVIGEPEDLASGGLDFVDKRTVQRVKEELTRLASGAHHLVVHFAPPCASFSRARDRAKRTKLRSAAHPDGIPSKVKACRIPNLVAKKCFKLARWAARILKAKVSVDNPAGSYLWAFSETLETNENYDDWVDVEFDTCRFGAPYKKSTRLRCWNWRPSKLANKCTKEDDTYTCGVKVSEDHAVLGFEGLPTSEAAAYVPKLCREWALAIADATSADAATEET